MPVRRFLALTLSLALALVIVRDASRLSGWDRLGLVVIALVVLLVTAIPTHTR